ncbi:MAG: DoxX family membrane protein [Planctomycetota bacterium]|jgi:uncharacterized membrane protein YphA (DoxX/SURF4 family)
MERKAEQTAAAGLAVLRIATGAVLLHSAWSGLAPASPTGEELRATVEAALPSLSGLLAWWGETVLLENPEALAPLWRWSLLLVGLALLTGALTRPMAILGAALTAHAWAYGSDALAVHHILLTVACVVFAVTRAGRILGLDSALDSMLPAWLTLIPENRRRY